MVSGDTRRWQIATVAVSVLLVGTALGTFAADLGAARPGPVPFDETVKLGLSAETAQAAQHRDATIPRVEVFYSQYRYVVGYS
ncbi:MAG: copper-binding protein, partial [Haloplanus sp.]